jgi:hypothetical protein
MSDLRSLQEAMRAALHQGETAAFLASVDRGGRTPERRLEVYANMYFSRQVQALAEDFPLVRRLAGPELFERLAVTHVKRHPSTHPSLAFLGRGFEETLRSLELDAEAAVARLEWARALAFWAPDATLRTAQDLGALGARLSDEVLAFHPSLQLVTLAGGVLEVAAGADASVLALGSSRPAAVFRKQEAVHEVALQDLEAEALRRALGGAPFGEVCEAFARADAPLDLALQALREWVGDGWVVEL